MKAIAFPISSGIFSCQQLTSCFLRPSSDRLTLSTVIFSRVMSTIFRLQGASALMFASAEIFFIYAYMLPFWSSAWGWWFSIQKIVIRLEFDILGTVFKWTHCNWMTFDGNSWGKHFESLVKKQSAIWLFKTEFTKYVVTPSQKDQNHEINDT